MLKAKDRVQVKRDIPSRVWGKTTPYAQAGDKGVVKEVIWRENNTRHGIFYQAYVQMEDGSSKRFRLTSLVRI